MGSSSAREWDRRRLAARRLAIRTWCVSYVLAGSPTLATADQVMAFMEVFEETPIGDRVSSRSTQLRDSSPREQRGRSMTRTMVQEMEVPIRIVRLPAVQARTGLGRSTIYVRLAEGSFPRPVQLGARA